MNFYRDENVSVITDTHFGRTFKEGVSLDRRGEYEAKILDDFGKFLLHPQTNIVVHAGDLFDTPEVNYEVLLNVYNKIRNAALENPLVCYYFIAGNHDLNRDDSKNEHCSFRLLQILLKTERNVEFVLENLVVRRDNAVIDLFKGCTNVNITNNRFEVTNKNSTAGGCIWVRNSSVSGNDEEILDCSNINIDKNIFKSNSADEIIGVFGNGDLSNVNIMFNTFIRENQTKNVMLAVYTNKDSVNIKNISIVTVGKEA